MRPFRRSNDAEAGALTWTVGALAGCVLVGAALATGSGLMFLAAAVSVALITVFLARPLWGIAAVVAIRPTLDAWANTNLIGVPGHRGLNAGALMALVIIAVGAAYLAERSALLRRAPSIRAFAVFAFLAALSIPFSPVKSVGVGEVLRLLTIVVVYAVVFVVIDRTRDMAVIAGAVLVSGLIPALVAMYQTFAAGIPVDARGFSRAHGTLVTVDGLGILMALIITFGAPIAIARGIRWRWILWLAAPLAIAALISSYGRTGWAASVVGLLIVGAARYRWLVLALPALVLVVALAIPTTTSRISDLNHGATKYGAGNTFNGRVQMWQAALPGVERRPVIGQGFGSIPYEATRQVANDYVRAIVETGIPGLVAYVWLLLSCLAAAFRGMSMARLGGDRTAAAICLGSFAAVPVYMLMSADSNLMTQIVIAGAFWSMAACSHALAVRDWQGLRP